MSTDNEVTNINMLDWGMIGAFGMDKLNQFITQVYIQRYNSNDFLPPVSGSMDSGGGEWRYKIESFLMDRPRMFFKWTGMNDSRANMVMRVLGGNQINQKYMNQQWYAQSIEYFSPAQGPLLRFNLKLPDTPINVEADGTLYIDLKESDDFSLEFSDVEHDQKIGGDFFKQLFNKLDDSKRRYPFGKVDPEASDAWMRPRKIYMRTQKNLKSQEGEGAVLLFIQVGDEPAGALPDNDSSFEYLLREGETARVLFNRYSMVMRLTADDFKQLFGASAVELTKDNRNRVTRLRLTASSIVQPARFVRYVEAFGVFKAAYCEWRAKEFATQGGQTIDFVVNEKGIEASGLALNAKVAIGQTTLGDKAFLDLAGDNLPDFQAILDREVPKEIPLDYKVSFSYPKIGANAKVKLRETSAVGERASDERDAMELGAPGRQSTQVAEFVPSEFIARAVEWTKKKDSMFWDGSLKMALVSGYEVLFANNTKTENKLDFILNLIKLNFGEAIMIKNATLTMDGDVGGLISPQLTTFRLNDLEVVVQAGGSYPFTLSPAMSNIEWTLDVPNRNRRQGTISDKGVYTAPQANEIEGLFTHVRVTATDRDTKFSSSALVTVLKDPLIVNPLINSTSGLPLKIKAGVVGDANQPLTWSIKKTGTEGTLDKYTGNTVIYTPSTNFGTDPNVIFVVDEVTVSNGKQSATSYIVNRKIDPTNVIAYTVNANNTVQCQAKVNDIAIPAKWQVLVGPGKIDSDSGLYPWMGRTTG